MKTQKNLDNLLKKDFKISNPQKTFSQRLSLAARKNFLLAQANMRFDQILDETSFLVIKANARNKLPEKFNYHFCNDYFDISFTILSQVKNILTTKNYVVVKLNEFTKEYNYNDFINLDYSTFKNQLFSLDEYNFCFLESKYDKMKVLQLSF